MTDGASGASRAELFLDHLGALAPDAVPEYVPVDSTHPGLPGVTAVLWRDVPEPGLLTGITYGVSLADHEQWTQGRPELCVCVRSDDPAWVVAVAHVGEQLRGRCPFRYGDVLDLGGRVAPESAMDGFVVFAPAVMDRDDARVDVGEDRPVHLMGLYPVHPSERAFLAEHGLEAFWDLEWDMYDVRRPPAV